MDMNDNEATTPTEATVQAENYWVQRTFSPVLSDSNTYTKSNSC